MMNNAPFPIGWDLYSVLKEAAKGGVEGQVPLIEYSWKSNDPTADGIAWDKPKGRYK